jgi:hypothetical protein
VDFDQNISSTRLRYSTLPDHKGFSNFFHEDCFLHVWTYCACWFKCYCVYDQRDLGKSTRGFSTVLRFFFFFSQGNDGFQDRSIECVLKHHPLVSLVDKSAASSPRLISKHPNYTLLPRHGLACSMSQNLLAHYLRNNNTPITNRTSWNQLRNAMIHELAK